MFLEPKVNRQHKCFRSQKPAEKKISPEITLKPGILETNPKEKKNKLK